MPGAARAPATGTQPYLLSGDRWSNATPITYSIAADGVTWDRKANDLNAAMDARFAADAWQAEIARALQTWASVADIDFVRVADSALAFDTVGKAQGDARFGDIRFGGYDFGNASQLAHAYTPPPNGSTAAGEVALNTAMAFDIGGDYDLFSVVLHETGHSLGLEHPDNPDAVMNQNYGGVRAGLSADDIAGIRAIYGARADDGYGQQGRGSGFSDAVAVAAAPASPRGLAGGPDADDDRRLGLLQLRAADGGDVAGDGGRRGGEPAQPASEPLQRLAGIARRRGEPGAVRPGRHGERRGGHGRTAVLHQGVGSDRRRVLDRHTTT